MRTRLDRERGTHWRPDTFTDREAELAAFRALFDDLSPEHARVLALHGISGNGKSWLARQLRHELDEQPPHDRIPYAWLDLDGETALPEHEFLRRIRNGLAETGGIDFVGFDIAFGLYWAANLPKDSVPPLAGSAIVCTERVFA